MAGGKFKTSLVIDDKLWKSFKIWCIKNKTTMTREIEKFIKGLLSRGKKSIVEDEE